MCVWLVLGLNALASQRGLLALLSNLKARHHHDKYTATTIISDCARQLADHDVWLVGWLAGWSAYPGAEMPLFFSPIRATCAPPAKPWRLVRPLRSSLLFAFVGAVV